MNRKKFLQLGVTGLAGTAFSIKSRAHHQETGYGSSGISVPANHFNKEVFGRNAMVCASHPLAVAAGYDILKSGGTAVDAAIAANAVLCVTEPMMCGVGGDLFAIVWNEKERKLYGLN